MGTNSFKEIGRPRGKRIKNHLEKIREGKTAARCVEPSDTISVHVLESNEFLVSLCVELKACFQPRVIKMSVYQFWKKQVEWVVLVLIYGSG